MKNKLFSVCLTVLFVNIFIVLFQRSDSIRSFIPLIGTISRRPVSISAYDFFLVLAVLLLRFLYRYFGISLSHLSALQHSLLPVNIPELVILALSGILTHFFLVPLFLSFFCSPLSALMHCPDDIRRVALMLLPLFWLLAIAIFNKGIPYIQQNKFVLPGPPP